MRCELWSKLSWTEVDWTELDREQNRKEADKLNRIGPVLEWVVITGEAGQDWSGLVWTIRRAVKKKMRGWLWNSATMCAYVCVDLGCLNKSWRWRWRQRPGLGWMDGWYDCLYENQLSFCVCFGFWLNMCVCFFNSLLQTSVSGVVVFEQRHGICR